MMWTLGRRQLKTFLTVLVFSTLITHMTTGRYIKKARLREPEEDGKPVYLFLKLWSPPILQYHEQTDVIPPPAPHPQVSPYSFYHTYGKRCRGCSHKNIRQSNHRRRSMRQPRDHPRYPRLTVEYLSEEESQW